jgi:prophage tail gpP-like protein
MADFAILAKGKRFIGFTQASVWNSIEAIAGTFTFTFVDRSMLDLPLGIPYGDDVIEVEVNGQTRLKGYIEGIQPQIGPDSRLVSVFGREVTCDIIDCHIESLRRYNGPLGKVIREILSPYEAVKVQDLSPVAERNVSTAVDPGESLWTVIERLSRKAGALLWTNGDGIIRIGQPQPVNSGVVLDRRTIKQGSARFDSSDIYSRYVVKGSGQSSDSLGWGAGAAQTAVHESAFLRRKRTWVKKAESEHTPSDTKSRAIWEGNIRLARGIRAQLTLAGLKPEAIERLACNSLTLVDCPELGLNQDMLVTSVELSTDAMGGELITVELVTPGAYAPEPLNAGELYKSIGRTLGW